jgi:type VII secretion-associated protein (TIGR03931 family)
MNTHMIEVGPNAIRQLNCPAATVDTNEMVRAAFDSIDDPVTLIGPRPVDVATLWRTVLDAYACDSSASAIVVHPSWWAPRRVNLLSGAAEVLADEVVLQPRSWLLTQASPDQSRPATVVEIADCFVVVYGDAVVAETRRGESEHIAGKIIRSIRQMTPDPDATVVIDVPSTVTGSGALAAMIADRLRAGCGISVVEVDDSRMNALATQVARAEAATRESPSIKRSAHRRHRWPVLAAVLLIVAASWLLGVRARGRHPLPVNEAMPTTFLVEGHVALKVPEQWPLQRVVAGPGSARVQVTSPSDPEVALHVTQSPVAIASLSATAESLKNAIDAEPSGVFVDFNPVGMSAGRPAVTYREVRPGHDIRWIVLVDKTVRISIGCQSRHGQDDVVQQVCEMAVRSARAVT